MDYILNEDDINNDLISNSFNLIHHQIDELLKNTSNWIFKKGNFIDIQIAKYSIPCGGSHIKTPKKLANTKGTINLDNSKTKDNKCLKHATSAFNVHRISEGKLKH